MSVNLTINGATYAYPETGDENWGTDATDWASAVTSGMLQKAGGNFTLLAEVDFGATYGLKSAYYKSRTANIADAGQIRLARADVISWRNQANSANLDLSVNASNVLLFDGVAIQTIASVTDTSTIDLTLTGTALSADIVTDSITNTYINSAAAIAYSKLAALTASRALQSSAGGVVEVSAVTSTELGYVSGVTSAIQTQLNGKQASGNYITSLTGDVVATGPGAAAAVIQAGVIVNSMISASAAIAFSKMAALTASRALVSDGSGIVSVATTTATEIGYVNGVTSSIQTQFGTKVTGPASATDDAIVTYDGTTGRLVQDSVAILTGAGALSGLTALTVDNINIDLNSIISTNSNGNIILTPNGTGKVQISANKGLLLSDDDSSVGVLVKVPATLTSDWTLTLPDNDGTTGQYLQTNGSGVSSWQTVSASPGTVSAKSADYTITDSDGIYLVAMTTGATDRTVTLPTAADNANRIIATKKVDTGAGICTLDGEGGELIDGISDVILAMPNESVTVVCNATGWYKTDRYYGNSVTETWADSEANATTTVTLQRQGNEIKAIGNTLFSGAFAGTSFTITIPAKYPMDVSVYGGTLTATRPEIGFAAIYNAGSGVVTTGEVIARSATELRILYNFNSSNNIIQASPSATAPQTWASPDRITWDATWIVSGWD